MAQGAGHKGTGVRRAPRRVYGARKASWVAYLTSGRAWVSTSDRGWRLSPTSHLEGLEGPYPGGRWVCKAVTLLTPCLFYPLDFRTDPGTGANPRPAWLPGAERRCSVSGALWKSKACAHGAGQGVVVGRYPCGIHGPEIPSNLAQFLPVVYFCPLSGSLLAI